MVSAKIGHFIVVAPQPRDLNQGFRFSLQAKRSRLTGSTRAGQSECQWTKIIDYARTVAFDPNRHDVPPRYLAEANRSSSERMQNVPNIRETSLDDELVEAPLPFSAPRLLPSGATVVLDIHNIGGLRQFKEWEVADIAVIVHIYRDLRLLASKIGLLQSKRLFPKKGSVSADDAVNFGYGINGIFHPEKALSPGLLSGKLPFDGALDIRR